MSQQVCNPICQGAAGKVTLVTDLSSFFSSWCSFLSTFPSVLSFLSTFYPLCQLLLSLDYLLLFVSVFPFPLNPPSLSSVLSYLHSVNFSLSGWWGMMMMKGRWVTRTATVDSQLMTLHQSKNYMWMERDKYRPSTEVERGESRQWKEGWYGWPLEQLWYLLSLHFSGVAGAVCGIWDF